MTNTRAELADERVGLVARAIEREAEECGFSIFSGDAESIARAVLSALRGQGEGWQGMADAPKDGTPLILFARAMNATAPVPVLGWWLPELGWIESCFWPNKPVGIEPIAWMPRPAFPSFPAPPSQTGGDHGR